MVSHARTSRSNTFIYILPCDSGSHTAGYLVEVIEGLPQHLKDAFTEINKHGSNGRGQPYALRGKSLMSQRFQKEIDKLNASESMETKLIPVGDLQYDYFRT